MKHPCSLHVCSFQPAFRDTDRSRASLALYLFRVKAGTVPTPSGESVEMPGKTSACMVDGMTEPCAVCAYIDLYLSSST